MKKWWNTYFYWNRTERRGIVPLLLLMCALACANLWVRYRETVHEPVSDPEFLALARQFDRDDADDTPGGAAETRRYAKEGHGKYAGRQRFAPPSGPFDPNGYPKDGWVKLGLSEKQAGAIKRFEEKGGRFHKKEDLRKMFVVSEEFYRHIEPFLSIPETAKKGYGTENRLPATETVKVDINRADSAELTQVKGITPALARRILAIRRTFGGLYGLEQVKDLKGFYAGHFDRLSAAAFAGPVTIVPLHLNYCTFRELLAVPGMEYETVKTIIGHRERHGPFKKTEDLVTLNLAEPGLYAKIAPYLTVK